MQHLSENCCILGTRYGESSNIQKKFEIQIQLQSLFATQVWCTLTNLVLVYAAEQEQKFNIGALLVRLGGGWRLEAACNAAIVCG